MTIMLTEEEEDTLLELLMKRKSRGLKEPNTNNVNNDSNRAVQKPITSKPKFNRLSDNEKNKLIMSAFHFDEQWLSNKDICQHIVENGIDPGFRNGQKNSRSVLSHIRFLMRIKKLKSNGKPTKGTKYKKITEKLYDQTY